ncbi:hypothetical protein SAMN04488505_1021094 [Chitinophaga rupis]|uniref:Uncharacterized protein n=1 Tax=Chitinophaga rupis TaxID=573321 RepID=A0A1H7T0W2_9BACT|nr:hypothetical protein [Chitinophaga rupis]SEL77884.1 hypothetical protein SAMN04488505_1021094 [Chitinophaga rupis]
MEFMITHYQISPLVHGIRKCRFIYALDDGTITVVCVNGRRKMQDFLANTGAIELEESVSIYEKANEIRRMLGKKPEPVPQEAED